MQFAKQAPFSNTITGSIKCPLERTSLTSKNCAVRQKFLKDIHSCNKVIHPVLVANHPHGKSQNHKILPLYMTIYDSRLLAYSVSKTTALGSKRLISDRTIETVDQIKKRARLHPNTLTEDDWTYILTHEEFEVTRKHGTERPFSCKKLYEERRTGLYHCICCHTALFFFGA